MGDDLTADAPQTLATDSAEAEVLEPAARDAAHQLAPHLQPAVTNPARVYLSSLESPGSRRTLAQALNVVADLLLPGADLDTLPWAMLRYQHTAAVRAALAERYDYRTANTMLSALRQTLRQAWQLGQMEADAVSRPDRSEDHGRLRPARSSQRICEMERSPYLLWAKRLRQGNPKHMTRTRSGRKLCRFVIVTGIEFPR